MYVCGGGGGGGGEYCVLKLYRSIYGQKLTTVQKTWFLYISTWLMQQMSIDEYATDVDDMST
jgi:hypothetical protein